MQHDAIHYVPSHSATSVRIGSWLMLLITLATLWTLSSFAVAHGSAIAKISASFDLELPQLTRIMLGIPTAAIIISTVITSVALLAKECLLRNKVTSLIVNIIVLVCFILFYEVYREAMSLPMRNLLKEIA